MDIKYLIEKIELLDNYYLSEKNIDLKKVFNVKGKILYDKNGAPYHRSLLISKTNDGKSLTIIKKKENLLLGIGIDLIKKDRIKKHDFSKSKIFFSSELKQIDDKYNNYLKILSIKEASFKALAPLYRKENTSSNIFDFEINKKIIPHKKSKKILDKYSARIKYQVLEDNDYIFVVSVCLKK